jgi:transglutaminase-like putative cysteine protease
MQPPAIKSSGFENAVLWLQRAGWALVLAAATLARAAETSLPNVAPPSSWVQPNVFDQQTASASLDPGADLRLLLLEQQINAAENEAFYHTAGQILTVAGVQKEATLTIGFNPSCQSLTLHWVRLWRGAQQLDRLDTNSIKVVQPEREMDQYILNGKKSAVLVLNDVRVGDIIDYAFSLKGANPVFGNHFAAALPMQVDEPADRLLARVLWPQSRHLYAKAHRCSVTPRAVPAKDSLEYIWDQTRLPGLTVEDHLPEWCDPQPWVQLSEFKTWAEVNQWALTLFQNPAPAAPELTAQIAAWKRLPGREEQILSALRFVQEQVRYFGIEIGASTEKPADPSAVFARRFGDCKDKSLLFVTILRALGLQAFPVLVNADLGRGIADWQPSAGAFDHCIAVAQCDGRAYWLDPTMNYQRGPLAAHYLPDYGCGLVIAPGTSALTPIPQTTALTRTTTSEYFLLRGKTEAADLKVVTVAEGRDAEMLRGLFAETKRSDLEKKYTHFYAGVYPGAKMANPIAVEDDQQQNRFQTTEYYSIDNIWTPPDKGGAYRCDFYAAPMSAVLKKPDDVERRLPLGVRFPEHQFLRTEVILPQAWPSAADRKSVADGAFTFQKAFQCAGNKLVMEYDYQALADAVAPAQVGQHVQRLNDAAQLLGYTLTWR